ncbi:DNA replication protein DnaC [compost metagenome]
MANPISNFTRQPERRPDAEGAANCVHCGAYTEVRVEQFEGGFLPLGCPGCHFRALHCEPADSERYQAAKEVGYRRALNQLLVGSGITPRFRDSTLDTFVTDSDDPELAKALSKARAKCQAYAERFPEHYKAGRAALLVGNIGTGKTHLASAIVQHVIREHGARAAITSAAEIIRVAKGVMRKGAQYTDRDVIEELADFDLLVIDEVGAQTGTEFERGLLHEVIDRRYQMVRPTVLVSNLTIEQLAAFIGERALDRLRQGGGVQVGFTWGSVRREVDA